MSRILLLGANSFSGHLFAEKYCDRHEIIGTVREPRACHLPKSVHLEIIPESVDPEQILPLLEKHDADVLINFIAMGNVDECEKNQSNARRVNVDFPVTLAKALKQNHSTCMFVQVSSNAVYAGNAAPYSEDSPKHPVNFYGYTKLLADQGVSEAYNNVLIARPITMFGASQSFQRLNPLSFVVQRLRDRQPLALVDDVYGNLLWVDDFVRILESLISNGTLGEFNIAGPERIDRWEFGRRIAQAMNADPGAIRRVGSDEFPALAPRPMDTTFDTAKIQALGLSPTPLDESIRLSIQGMGSID